MKGEDEKGDKLNDRRFNASMRTTLLLLSVSFRMAYAASIEFADNIATPARKELKNWLVGIALDRC